jgi:hypothetical protein
MTRKDLLNLENKPLRAATDDHERPC